MTREEYEQEDDDRREALEEQGLHQDAIGYLPCLGCCEATMGALCAYCEEAVDAGREPGEDDYELETDE